MASFFENTENRKWLLKLIILILIFVFLSYSVWLFFAYRMEALKLIRN